MKPAANQIVCGNNIDVVKSWPANCIDSILTDPPYGLGFMGKKWDTLIEKSRDSAGGFLRDGKSGSNPYAAARCRHGSDSIQMQEWYYQWAKAMLRITKPGGFLLCFGGTRTYHRLTCAIEDAGWQIRDCMMFLYGSGFPKSHNISKALEKKGKNELAKLWKGMGTALKPAFEPILLCQKPLDGTFAHNAEAHGVAGLNIDGGRIGTEIRYNQKAGNPTDKNTAAFHAIPNPHNYQGKECQGRWPANLILDEEAGAMLDEQSGVSRSNPHPHKHNINQETIYGGGKGLGIAYGESNYSDKGGASRFFYCAKASHKERNLGLDAYEKKPRSPTGKGLDNTLKGPTNMLRKDKPTLSQNNHPTVKPLALMKYLCTLLKMPSAGQIILDPFLGSGTTGIACKELGINFIGIEKELEYCEIAVKRIAAVPGQEITLETTLPVTKNVETSRTPIDSAGGGRRPNESLPHVSEHRQSIINVAVAKLKNKK